MAEAVKLINVADDAGLQFRVAYFLVKQSAVILDAASPDPNQLTLAKDVSLNGGMTHAPDFARMLVTVDAVATALETAGYQHTAFDDAQLETQVNALWPTYAKALG